MAKRLPAHRPPAPRVIHYVDPAPAQSLAYRDLAGLAVVAAAQQQEQQLLIARWRLRQQQIAERDKKVRSFWRTFGAVLALGVMTGIGALGWLLWTGLGLGLLAVPVLIALAVVMAVGGHRCITVIQHWH